MVVIYLWKKKVNKVQEKTVSHVAAKEMMNEYRKPQERWQNTGNEEKQLSKSDN